MLAGDVSRLFTTDARNTGASLSYHGASALGGGVGPIVAVAVLNAASGNVFFIALLPAVVALIMLICVILIPRFQVD